MSSKPFPAPISGTLQLYRRTPIALPYFDTNASLPHSLVFVPGLRDTMGTLPYLPALSRVAGEHGFSLVLPQLSSNMGGYGQCTLEGDAQEMASCVAHLRQQGKSGKMVLMGHSTGCQDAIAYLLGAERARGEATRVDGAILQAPVSDREWYESQRDVVSAAEWDKMEAELEHATNLVRSGQGSKLLPRQEVVLPTQPGDAGEGNAAAMQDPAMTAYRLWSLRAKGGDDDFFSLDLSDEDITAKDEGARGFGRAVANLQAAALTAKILALIGDQDDSLPEGNADRLLERWTRLLGPTGGFEAKILQGANHQASSDEATAALAEAVSAFLAPLGTQS
ncbi:Protein of unknown function DUF1749 [Kalmanozyma brasiliensis GHG001]|uniref:AB hydrolase-1 domain-containing protein n=1 Tax=Kalmanozyma brasiliensis (strain GHG001) TaxID=1365824 RepID=V5EX95_KALBG|nr:Protein of unknown function DUF1749 [Kalmanozyma brasiliensis GHG001]EST07024.1 Protein of unknown function DUF1749 [Kalmanozyma brasiliensis GHG001]